MDVGARKVDISDGLSAGAVSAVVPEPAATSCWGDGSAGVVGRSRVTAGESAGAALVVPVATAVAVAVGSATTGGVATAATGGWLVGCSTAWTAGLAGLVGCGAAVCSAGGAAR